MFRLVLRLLVTLPLVVAPLVAGEEATDAYRYVARESGPARLSYVNGVPLLVVAGTPEEIGKQTAELVGDAAIKLVDFPKLTLEARGKGDQWPTFRTAVQVFRPNIPESHLAEITAYSKVSGVAVDRIVAANVMPDVYRAFGCSSLVVESERSATGAPLFARNLDFFTLGKLQRYDLVTVVRPKGKHAFVSVGFPGLVGVLSGMNDAGLSLAVHEVQTSKDEAAMLNWLGVPYTMAFRRVLEECTTIEEARKLLAGIGRTTKLNLAVCDRNTSAVFEITPKTLAVRTAEKGLCSCTNHFRTDELATSKVCERFDTLVRTGEGGKVNVAMLRSRLHDVNQGTTTLQSMIFEPKPLKLHVSLDGQPSSKGPFRTLDLAKLLAGEE